MGGHDLHQQRQGVRRRLNLFNLLKIFNFVYLVIKKDHILGIHESIDFGVVAF